MINVSNNLKLKYVNIFPSLAPDLKKNQSWMSPNERWINNVLIFVTALCLRKLSFGKKVILELVYKLQLQCAEGQVLINCNLDKDGIKPCVTWFDPITDCFEQEAGPETSWDPFQLALSCEPRSDTGGYVWALFDHWAQAVFLRQ